MNAFIDFEFNNKNIIVDNVSYNALDMISIGVCTDDDKSFYAISSEFDIDHAMNNKWMRENVMIHIYNSYRHFTKCEFSSEAIKEIIFVVGKTKYEIACDLYNFFNLCFK